VARHNRPPFTIIHMDKIQASHQRLANVVVHELDHLQLDYVLSDACECTLPPQLPGSEPDPKQPYIC
jgi:hypothetical protein